MEARREDKTLGSYIVGLVLCVMLTLAAFGIIEYRLLDGSNLYVVLTMLALIQLVVQSVCFLGLNASKEGKWDLLPFLFTVLVVVILLGGSMWVIYNLNANMLIPI